MWGFPASATRASFRYSHFSGLGHRNTAISVEACSDGKFIVTSAEQGYSVPTTSLTWKFRLKCGGGGFENAKSFQSFGDHAFCSIDFVPPGVYSARSASAVRVAQRPESNHS